MKTRSMLLVAILLAAPAAAKEQELGRSFDPGSFRERKALIERELAVGERYVEIGKADRERVLQALDRMEALLAGIHTLEQLDGDARAALFNDQELVNTLLTRAPEDSRLFCRREHTVGTRFKVTHCATLAERKQLQRDGQNVVRTLQQPKKMDPPGGN